MPFSWFKSLRRKQLFAEPMPSAWYDYLDNNVRHYRYLVSPQRRRVEQVVQVFVAEKHWVGGAGLEVTDEMKVTVAGQAAILGLGLDEPYYFDRVQSLILYKGLYRHPAAFRDRGGLVGEAVPLAGEAWHRGPIVLSWRNVLTCGQGTGDGGNVVVHEFAHYLDGLDGDFDGTPPIAGREQQRTWYRVTEGEYLRLLGQARRHEITLLDHYGASNRGEFFAVASECFFERPRAMRRAHAELYGVLQDFYRQDPADWLPDAEIPEPAAAIPPRALAAQKHQRRARLAMLRSRRPDALFTLALEYQAERRYGLAAAAATRAIAANAHDGEAYVQRALARVELGRYQQALADCQSALQNDVDDPCVYRACGAAYFRLGRYDEALRALDRAVKEDTADSEAYYLRGRVRAQLGDNRRAAADFAQSLAIRPLVAEVYYHSGLANRDLGNAADAASDLGKAFQLDPQVERSN